MRWTRWIGFGGALVSVAVAFVTWSCTSQTKSAGMTNDEKIARGEYLVAYGGCNDCHTPGGMYGNPDSTQRRLAGSELGWTGPWGTSYARNLTPDAETGIGNWTEDQIVTTLKTGKRPDDSPLLPPMPWPSIARLPDEDIHALAFYLKSIPAVHHEVPKVVPPGVAPPGPALVFPPPPPWEVSHMGPPAAAADTSHGGS